MINLIVNNTKYIPGFTLLEMLVVLGILSILLSLAIPSSAGKYSKIRIQETIKLVDNYKFNIEMYYRTTGAFPQSNAQASIPQPKDIIGNYLQATYLDQGAFHLELGNKIGSDLHGKKISIRPIFVPDIANAPISWICGYDTIPDSMQAAGENKTNISPTHLPIICR